jgi:hypothetical protein
VASVAESLVWYRLQCCLALPGRCGGSQACLQRVPGSHPSLIGPRTDPGVGLSPPKGPKNGQVVSDRSIRSEVAALIRTLSPIQRHDWCCSR